MIETPTLDSTPFDVLLDDARDTLAGWGRAIDDIREQVANGGEIVDAKFPAHIADCVLRARSRVAALEICRDRWLQERP